jgi:hypothetical protein
MPARKPGADARQAVVDAGLCQHVERRASRGGAHRIAVQRVGRPDHVGARARPCVEHAITSARPTIAASGKPPLTALP